MPQSNNTRGTKLDRADHNKERTRDAIRELNELLAEACHPSFAGTVSIFVGSDKGRLGTIKQERVKYNKV